MSRRSGLDAELVEEPCEARVVRLVEDDEPGVDVMGLVVEIDPAPCWCGRRVGRRLRRPSRRAPARARARRRVLRFPFRRWRSAPGSRVGRLQTGSIYLALNLIGDLTMPVTAPRSPPRSPGGGVRLPRPVLERRRMGSERRDRRDAHPRTRRTRFRVPASSCGRWGVSCHSSTASRPSIDPASSSSSRTRGRLRSHDTITVEPTRRREPVDLQRAASRSGARASSPTRSSRSRCGESATPRRPAFAARSRPRHDRAARRRGARAHHRRQLLADRLRGPEPTWSTGRHPSEPTVASRSSPAATSGIGRAIADALAGLGATVVVVGRDEHAW